MTNACSGIIQTSLEDLVDSIGSVSPNLTDWSEKQREERADQVRPALKYLEETVGENAAIEMEWMAIQWDRIGYLVGLRCVLFYLKQPFVIAVCM